MPPVPQSQFCENLKHVIMRQTKKEILQGIEDKVQSSRIIGNNTLGIFYKDGTEAIRFHNTDILFVKDGIVTLNSGGWKTNTTKDRINGFLRHFDVPFYIQQRNHQWFIGEGVFYDGMQFRNDEQISPIMKDNADGRSKMLKRIRKYCALITKDNLPFPDSGDCWYCLMKTDKDKKTLGDAFGDTSHLVSHLEEGYVVGSLLVNAMREAGYRNEQISFHYQLKLVDTFKRVLKKYLIKRLIAQ